MKIDKQWLLSQCNSQKDEDAITSILEDRDKVYKYGSFIDDKSIINATLDNIKFRFRRDSAYSCIETYYEIFKEDNHFILPDYYENNKLTIDVGANIGCFALRTLMLNKEASIICVEPNRHAFELLRANVIKNELLARVIILNKAVSDDDSGVDLEYVEEIPCITGKYLKMVERPWLKDEMIKKINVPSISIPKLLDFHDIGKVDLLKIDIEGMEGTVLNSCKSILNKIDKIIVEYHGPIMVKKVTKFLKDNGFLIDLIEEAGDFGDIYSHNDCL